MANLRNKKRWMARILMNGSELSRCVFTKCHGNVMTLLNLECLYIAGRFRIVCESLCFRGSSLGNVFPSPSRDSSSH